MKTEKVTFKSVKDLSKLLEISRVISENYSQENMPISFLWLFLMGIMNKTYELTETIIWSLENKRPQTSAFMTRGLIETLSFMYCWDKKIVNVLNPTELDQITKEAIMGGRNEGAPYKAVSIKTCIEKASKEFPDIMKRYNDLSEMVHPNSKSHFYIFQPKDDVQQIAEFSFPFYDFKENDQKATINVAGECASHIIDICEKIFKRFYGEGVNSG